MRLLESVLYSFIAGRKQAFIDYVSDSPGLTYRQKQALKTIASVCIFLCKCMGLVGGITGGVIAGLLAGSIGGPVAAVGAAIAGGLIGGGVGYILGFYAGLSLTALNCLALIGYNKLVSGTQNWFSQLKRSISNRFQPRPPEHEVLVSLHATPRPTSREIHVSKPMPTPPPAASQQRAGHYGYLYRLAKCCTPSFMVNPRRNQERTGLLTGQREYHKKKYNRAKQ
jgi:hypothetical protein